MDEQDLFEKLSESTDRKHSAKDFLSKIKTSSSLGDIANVGASFLSKDTLIAAAGASAIVLAEYLSNLKGKSGKTTSQQIFDKGHEVAERMEGDSFGARTGKVLAKSFKDVADIAADHPFKASLPLAPLGATAGLALAKRFLK